jgi:hypothetical protein
MLQYIVLKHLFKGFIMGMLMIAIGVGFFGSIIAFFIAEEMSLKDANFSDMKCLITEEISINECMNTYSTIKYMAMYFMGVFILGVIMSTQILIPNGLGLGEIMAYVFIPALIGSLVILLIKWKFQPLLKIISSFLFGGGYMAASGLSIAITYLFVA